MRMKGVVMSAMLVVVAIVSLMVMQGEAIDCGQVSSTVAPCVPYLTGADTAPSAGCCAGVKKMNTLAPTTADRRAACDCLKAAAAQNPNIKDDAASFLPKKCGVVFNIPISKSMNCQTIN